MLGASSRRLMPARPVRAFHGTLRWNNRKKTRKLGQLRGAFAELRDEVELVQPALSPYKPCRLRSLNLGIMAWCAGKLPARQVRSYRTVMRKFYARVARSSL